MAIRLKPNTGEETILISKKKLYVKITDYGATFLLREIRLSPGQNTWEWIPLKVDKELDLTGIDNHFCSFENAINREVNDPFCTIYVFNGFAELCYNWSDVEYVDTIVTKYVGDEKQ